MIGQLRSFEHMRTIFIVLISLFLVGCKDDFHWRLKYVPTTQEERVAVAKHVEAILQPMPQTLSGDPDYDDSVNAVYEQARIIFCKPTMWEKDSNWQETGRWRYCETNQEPYQPEKSDFHSEKVSRQVEEK